MVFYKLLGSETKEADALIRRFGTSIDQAEAKVKKTAAAKQNFLLGRAILRDMLIHVTGDNSWQIHKDECGKPYVVNSFGIGPNVSISHSSGWVVCALSTEGEVGVDIERWKPRNFTAITNYAFGPHECEAVQQGGEPAFYRIWTLREAMAKAAGKGMLDGINGKDTVTFFGNKESWISENWHLFYFIPHENYSLAVAVLGKSERIQISVVR